jgi:hypothetical protein
MFYFVGFLAVAYILSRVLSGRRTVKLPANTIYVDSKIVPPRKHVSAGGLIEIECPLDFINDDDIEPPTPRQLDALEKRSRIRAPEGLNFGGASLLISCSVYVDMVWHHATGSDDHSLPPDHVRKRGIEFIITTPEIKRAIKKYNREHWSSGREGSKISRTKYYREVAAVVAR